MKFLLALVAILMLLAAPACAISITSSTSGSAGGATAHGTYSLANDASLVSDVTLGGGALSRQSAVKGPGMIAEGVSSGSGSVSRTVTADGALSYAASDGASGAAVSSGMRASLSGSAGMFSTVSSGAENEMTVAGGFLGGGGDMSFSLKSVAADQAMTTGEASALGTQCLNAELTQGIAGQDAAVSVHALYVSDDKNIGEFGVVAQNTMGKTTTALETGASTEYLLTGYRWPSNPGIDIIVSSNSKDLPIGISADRVKSQISAAEVTWDNAAAEKLFDPVTTASKGFNRNFGLYSKRDGKNVHMWTSTGLSTSTIAMTVTWYTTSKVTGADGGSYNTAVESDCWYNNKLSWRIDTSPGGGAGTKTYDIQTIALHELGHTLGLKDLYDSSNTDQIMYGYNDGTSRWTLGDGDITGIQKLYGAS